MDEGFWRQTSDNKLVSAAKSDHPVPTGHDFVLTSTIAAAYTGTIWQDGTWDGTTYTPPTDIILVYDDSTEAGEVQVAAETMLATLESGAEFIRDNRTLWPQQQIEWALTGIHWQIVNAARIALNTTRTVAYRVKFCEEAASWPSSATGGGPLTYVDDFATMITEAPGEKFSWVDPDEDPPARTTTMPAPTTNSTHDQRRGRAEHIQVTGKGMAR